MNAETIRRLRDLAQEEGNFNVYEFLADLHEHAFDRYRAIAGEGMPPPAPGSSIDPTGGRTAPPRLDEPEVFEGAAAQVEQETDIMTLLGYYRDLGDAVDWLTRHGNDPQELARNQRLRDIVDQKIDSLTAGNKGVTIHDISEWPPNSDTFVPPVRQGDVEAQPGLFGGPMEATPPTRTPALSAETPDPSIQRNFQFGPEEVPPPSAATMDPRMAARVEAGGPREFDFTGAPPEQGQLFPMEMRRNRMMDEIGDFIILLT